MIKMYTFKPNEKFAKAFGRNLRVSRKSSTLLCNVIKKKTLVRAKRLLNDLSTGKRSLKGKYYSKTASELKGLLESCEKNAEFLGLDTGRLLVHASAHKGTIMRRRRRKSDFGTRMKSTNVEIFLIEMGKESKVKIIRSKKDLEDAVKQVSKKIKAKAAEKSIEKTNEDEKETGKMTSSEKEKEKAVK